MGARGEAGIDVGTQPVDVGDLVVRARRDEEPPFVLGAVRVALPPPVAVKGEPPFEAAGELGMLLAPSPPGGERFELRQAVIARQALERDRGERRRRLAKREARMAAAFEEDDAAAAASQEPGEERAREARAGHGDVEPFIR